MSLFSQFTGSSSENTSLGGYALFSGQNPNLITLPDGKVFLKGGVLAKASDFPNVPSDRTAYLNPLVPVSDIGSGGRYTSITIDPSTGYPVILCDSGYGSVIHMYGTNTTSYSDCVLSSRLLWTTYNDVRFNKIAFWGKEDAAVVTQDARFSSTGQATIRSAAFVPRRPNSSTEPVGLFSNYTYAMSTYGSWNTTTVPASGIAVNPTGNIVVLDSRTPGNVSYTASSFFTAPTVGTLPSTNNWISVAYGGTFNEYVAIAHNTNATAYSTNGTTWTTGSLPVRADWRDITCNGAMFVAVASNSNIAATSQTGTAFAQRTLPAVADWSATAYSSNLNLWVAVARNSNIAATSGPSGQTWTQRTLPATADWADVEWSPRLGCFVAVADDGRAAAAISYDGINWSSKVLPRHMTFGYLEGDGNTRFWAQEDTPGISGNFNIAASTDNGASWRYYRSNTAIVSSSPLSIRYLNGNLWYAGLDGFAGINYSVAYVRSPDGNIALRSNVNPTDNQATYPTDLTYFGNIFVGIVNNSSGSTGTTSYVTSTDGITWTNRTMPATKTWTNLFNTGNSLVLVAYDSGLGGATLYNSSNGTSWTALSPWSLTYSNVLNFTYYDTAALYNPTANIGFYIRPGSSYLYITTDRGASFSVAPRYNSTNVSLNYPGDVYRISNNTWSRVTTANTIVNYDGPEGGVALSTYSSGYPVKVNYPPMRNFGSGYPSYINRPLLQNNEVYYLTSNSLLRVDANLYINNLNQPGISGGGISSAGTYYMRVK